MGFWFGEELLCDFSVNQFISFVLDLLGGQCVGDFFACEHS